MVKAILMLVFGVSGQASIAAVAGIFSTLNAKLEKAIEKCRQEFETNLDVIAALEKENHDLMAASARASRIQEALKKLA